VGSCVVLCNGDGVSGNPYYYLSDHLGSTAVIASGDGKTIQWEADYFPFGAVRQVFTNIASNNYEFTGYENDSDTGYNYAVARFDAGRWGRFLSPDPYLGSMDVTNPQSLNRFAYVLNNPLNLIDPLGLDCAYFNDAGDSIEQLDQNSDAAECGSNGGYWVDGGLQSFGFGDDGSLWLQGTNGGDTITFALFSGSSNQGPTPSGFDPSAFSSSYYNQSQPGESGGMFPGSPQAAALKALAQRLIRTTPPPVPRPFVEPPPVPPENPLAELMRLIQEALAETSGDIIMSIGLEQQMCNLNHGKWIDDAKGGHCSGGGMI
jgi:RHS repeat-associated protein